jgi:hypothetical protein
MESVAYIGDAFIAQACIGPPAGRGAQPVAVDLAEDAPPTTAAANPGPRTDPCPGTTVPQTGPKQLKPPDLAQLSPSTYPLNRSGDGSS